MSERCRSPSLAVASCGGALLLLFATEAIGEKPHFCEKGVDVESGDPNAYDERGTRCEGLYKRNDSGPPHLDLVSLREAVGAKEVGARNGKSIRVAWPTSGPSGATLTDVTIHGEADPGNRHYRMDTRSTLAAGYYDWPTEVLDSLQLSARDVSLLAFARLKLAGLARSVVTLPIRLGALSGSTEAYDFQLAGSAEVTEVFYRIDVWDSKWKQQKLNVKAPAAVRPANYPFPISVPVLSVPTPGALYRLTVKATLGEDSEPETCEVIFFHG